MAETMEKYMSKTRANYGLGVARPKIEDKDNFELKGQFLKELRTNTFSGSDHEDANEHIEKVLEIVDLFHIPNITIDQVMLRAFPMSLTRATSRWLKNKPTDGGKSTTFSKNQVDTLPAWQSDSKEILILDSRGAIPSKTCTDARPFQGGGYRAAAPGFYQRNNVNPSYQEQRQSMEDTLRASIKTLEIQIEQMSKVLQERGFWKLQESSCSTEANPRDQVKSISTTIEADSCPIRRIGSSQYVCEEKKGSYGPQFSKAYSEASHINNSIPRKEKDPRSFTLPCFINNVCFDNALVDLGASVSVMPLSTYLNLGLGELAHTKLTVELADRTVKYPKGIAENVLVRIGKFVFPITLRVEEERIIFTSVKPASSLIKRVYMLSLRERMELDFEARLMGETLVLNRSLDLFFEDYIELNDLNKPFELRRNQGDDLLPTIEEGEVIEEFRTMDDEIDAGINDYPSYCDDDKKIHIDCVHNLKFSCMIGFEFTHANFFPLLYVNVMSKKFHNSIMKDKMVYNGNNVVEALINVPIFVGTFSVVTDFAVLENMDAYLDEGMGDVIFGEQFLREVGIKTRRFKGMRVLRYLKGSLGCGIQFYKHFDLKLKAYADADWVKCPKTRRSVIGFCVILGKTLVSWISKKHATISKSSSETEYRSMSSASCEVVWIDKVLAGIIKTVKKSSYVRVFVVSRFGKDSAEKRSFKEKVRFQDPGPRKGRINFQFPNRLSSEQVADLETRISTDEIRSAVWGCGVDKSPGPDGFTFDFFQQMIDQEDFLEDVLTSFGFGLKWVLDPRKLKSGDPIAPFLFLLIMEAFHLSFNRAVEAGTFKGYKFDSSLTLSHLFYADDCGILGILVGDNMANLKAWDETIAKMIKRLSKWKLDTLSHSGLRRDFFYGVKDGDRKIAWIKWTKVLASKKFGGLGVSSLFALNRALIFKWVWRFLSHDNSLWSRVIAAVHGSSSHPISAAYNSPWGTIIKEVKALNDKEVNKDCSVADKINAPFTSFLIPFRSQLGGGPEGSSKLEPLSKSS
ncbi:reverse transcriptase domain-containing protein [Tanacetum coccineum]